MKRPFQLGPRGLALLWLALWCGQAAGQTAWIKTLYSFPVNNATIPATCPDGANPQAGLTLGPDGNFYGTTGRGGTGGGTMFRVTTAGLLTTLAYFDGANGANPYDLTLGTNGHFYGSTASGTIFQVTTGGLLTTIASLSGTNGSSPAAGLTLGSDGNFYGTASKGGFNNNGTVFRVTADGVLTSLARFNFTNGQWPYAALAEGRDGAFYGTTHTGGTSGPTIPNYGTVFRVTTNGALTVLAVFGNTNGAYAYSGLTLGSDGVFYGATQCGGVGRGNLFKITTNGVITSLVTFNGTNGAAPSANLTLGRDGNFYGTTAGGGAGDKGEVFKLTTKGVMTILASFSGSNGQTPNRLTLGDDGNFYGTTMYGGASGYGTVFTLVFPLQFLPATSHPPVTGAGFQARLIGPPNTSAIIEASADLKNWTPVSTNTLPPVDAGGLLLSLPPGEGQQFYRARPAP